jgi:hypothetical protein
VSDETTTAPAAEVAAKPVAEETKPISPEGGTTILAQEVKPEVKPEGEANAEEPKEVKPVAPEKYELKLPEDAVVDSEFVKEVEAIARQQGLSNDEAQMLLDQQSEKAAQLVTKKAEAWMEQLKTDPELGADLKQTAALAQRALENFAPPTLRGMLVKSGYGNHPDVVRFLYNIGKKMADDKLVIPGAQSGGEKPIQDVFYTKADA